MLNKESLVSIIDNSGAIKAKIIHLFKRPFAKTGNIVLVSLQKVKSQSKLKKGQLFLAIILQTRKNIIRIDNTKLTFLQNGVALLKADKTPVANRIYFSIPLELKKRSTIISLAPKLI